ncbi:aminoglycoside phosphotransferase family protein [Streptomyces roseirectus]|uniref:Aminoglycoside phosphotransferase family protein n=1 Tax=Streptomyces roseirectus TaxID=2768066 RepID=A0A7H0IGV3_9ACTN|nr:phosphotransferase [Streptomyces roseirectus]QNP72019.1 aminoglycoside phosphotransferase family protein [Streptomyces roseirectus]
MPAPTRTVEAAALADAYSLGPGPWSVTPVTRGALGQIWKLTGAGSAWAVKEMLFGCDEEQVRREAALRDAAERLGISAPRLHTNRDGVHVTRLGSSASSAVKLYDWVEGGTADASDPAILDWFGRTAGLIHRAGEGAEGPVDDWYERCPDDAEWKELSDKVRRAGLPWADDLDRFVRDVVPELSVWVGPSSDADLVMSHCDLQPQNVLVGPAGPVLLDWDNAGPLSAEQELARALFVWSGGNEPDTGRTRRIVRAYRAAGGPGVIRGPRSFSMLFATAVNYVRVQADCAVEPTVTEEQRVFGARQAVACMRTIPRLSAVNLLVDTVAAAD